MADTDSTASTATSSEKKVPPGLTPWKPGQSGNPAGYSKGRRMYDALLKRIDPTRIAESWAEQIEQGNWPAIKEAIEREDGKVPDRLDLLGEVQVRVTYSDEAEPTDADA